jgi:hypothetical protein
LTPALPQTTAEKERQALAQDVPSFLPPKGRLSTYQFAEKAFNARQENISGSIARVLRQVLLEASFIMSGPVPCDRIGFPLINLRKSAIPEAEHAACQAPFTMPLRMKVVIVKTLNKAQTLDDRDIPGSP